MSSGQHEFQEGEINFVIKEYLADEPFQDIENLQGKLEKLKCMFMKYDASSKGEIDYDTLSIMVQELGFFRTPSEMKKLVQETTGNRSNVVTFKEFAMVMLGRRSTMCQRIMRYNENRRELLKMPCLLDKVSYVSFVNITLSRGLPSPLAYYLPAPPPSPYPSAPPPSPADAIPGGAVTYPA
ncbi:allograft inflammatory factor 1-like [Microcaecilia unicolor]|uniref:Allograft inflammatory factor 1-like n=1 Tax=Microcaecilia unicolor TaxID=1415580 RepID=A0A6P7YJU0_9AMPH|nr:allograft inflammatory factor 1-like [Microcaecilia unicolor]